MVRTLAPHVGGCQRAKFVINKLEELVERFDPSFSPVTQ
jgi:hypothetical protein